MNNGKRDCYEVLGLGRTAAEQEIKSAYRKLALQYHPDRNPERKDECTEKFKEITEAYSILMDPQKRAAYDRYGHAGVTGSGFQPDSTIFTDFEDVFGDFFGDFFGRRSGRRTRAQRGADLRYDLEISFEEAVFGMETKIKIPRTEGCAACHGTGAKKGSQPVTCAACEGRGQIRHAQGFFTLSQTCPQCQGMGQVIRDACADCHGEGRIRQEKILGLKIPPGVDDGTRLRVSGEGEAGSHGGPSGDLYVVLKAREHPFFERQGSDLYCTIPVSLTQAALGVDLKVPTLDGKSERLRVPEGTQSGSVFRLRGRGVPSLDGHGHGDIYVSIQVMIPTRLSREQKRVLEVLGNAIRVDNKPLERRVAEKVKNIFG